MANNILIVAFEVGVVKGFENVRSAHIQVPYKLAMDLDKKGHSTRDVVISGTNFDS